MEKVKYFEKPVYCVFNDGKCIGVFTTSRLAWETCDVLPGSVIKVVSWSIIRRLLRENAF